MIVAQTLRDIRAQPSNEGSEAERKESDFSERQRHLGRHVQSARVPTRRCPDPNQRSFLWNDEAIVSVDAVVTLTVSDWDPARAINLFVPARAKTWSK